MSDRGSVREAEYFLKTAREVATVVRSEGLIARVHTRIAELYARQRRFDDSIQRLDHASKILRLPIPAQSKSEESEEVHSSQGSVTDPASEQGVIESSKAETPATSAGSEQPPKDVAPGPDQFEITRIRGDVFAKTEMVAEAGEMFDAAQLSVQTLEKIFNENEALIPSPRKLRASINAMTASVSRAARAVKGDKSKTDAQPSTVATDGDMEVVLLEQLKKVWRQQAWLLRESGFPEDSEDILQQIKNLTLDGEATVSHILIL